MERLQLKVINDPVPVQKKLQEQWNGDGHATVVATTLPCVNTMRQLLECAQKVVLMDVNDDWHAQADRPAQKASPAPAPQVFALDFVDAQAMSTQVQAPDALFYLVMPVKREEFDTVTMGGKQGVSALDKAVTMICLRAGIPVHLQGYHYIFYGIKMVIQTPGCINRVTSELYPGIAQFYHTTASKVERSIRHAITTIWEKGKIGQVNSIAGFEAFSAAEKPTNSAFIALLAACCEQQMHERGWECPKNP